jgi:predicted restriction endonuclease
MVAQRQGQGTFRRKLLEAYGGRCALTGCAVEAVLQAAHIHPYLGPYTNDVTNGLLLRADLHTLFDLRLITIDGSQRAVVSGRLKHTPYADLHGTSLRTPRSKQEGPSAKALEWHRTQQS